MRFFLSLAMAEFFRAGRSAERKKRATIFVSRRMSGAVS
jgi:hypothetical protein